MGFIEGMRMIVVEGIVNKIPATPENNCFMMAILFTCNKFPCIGVDGEVFHVESIANLGKKRVVIKPKGIFVENCG